MQSDRAKQFMAFDALKGYREKLKERERIIVEKMDFFEDYYESLDQILKDISLFDMIEIIYFDNDNYIKKRGILTKKDYSNRCIYMVKDKIDANRIIKIKKVD